MCVVCVGSLRVCAECVCVSGVCVHGCSATIGVRPHATMNRSAGELCDRFRTSHTNVSINATTSAERGRTQNDKREFDFSWAHGSAADRRALAAHIGYCVEYYIG